MQNRVQFVAVFVLALLAIAVAALALPPGSGLAAPPAAPTPITGVNYSPDGNYFLMWNSKALAASTTTDPLVLASFEQADFQYYIDQGASANNITMTVQFSNDNVNWVSGLALVTNNSTDAGDLTRIPLFGRYARVSATVANTNPVTVTVNLLAK